MSLRRWAGGPELTTWEASHSLVAQAVLLRLQQLLLDQGHNTIRRRRGQGELFHPSPTSCGSALTSDGRSDLKIDERHHISSPSIQIECQDHRTHHADLLSDNEARLPRLEECKRGQENALSGHWVVLGRLPETIVAGKRLMCPPQLRVEQAPLPPNCIKQVAGVLRPHCREAPCEQHHVQSSVDPHRGGRLRHACVSPEPLLPRKVELRSFRTHRASS